MSDHRDVAPGQEVSNDEGRVAVSVNVSPHAHDPAFQSLEHLQVKGWVYSLSLRYKLTMNYFSDVKEDNDHRFDARLVGAWGWFSVPLPALPFRLWVVFKHPGFISGYDRVQKVRFILNQIQQFLTEQNSLWSCVNTFGTSFAQTLRICRFLISIRCTVNVDMYSVSAILLDA